LQCVSSTRLPREGPRTRFTNWCCQGKRVPLKIRGPRSRPALGISSHPELKAPAASRCIFLRVFHHDGALAFKDAYRIYRMLYQRIGIFTALPLRSLDQLSLQNKLREIGRMQGATAKAAEPT
jgi:hypothetical protein